MILVLRYEIPFCRLMRTCLKHITSDQRHLKMAMLLFCTLDDAPLVRLMKKHTIVSDAGVGESTWGWGYEYQFREGGKYYKEQQKGHEIWETK